MSERDPGHHRSRDHSDQLWEFAKSYGGKHPAASAVGILIVISFLGLLLVTVGKDNNTSFIQLLLMLITISGALYFSFTPPSASRFAVSILGCIVVSCILLDSPIPLRTAIARLVTAQSNPPPTPSSPTPATSAANPQPTAVRSARTLSFSVPGSYLAVGCEETATARVEFQLPDGATLDTSEAQWINTSNISSSEKRVQQVGRTVVAEGTLRGLARQMILGIGNCPGGGHGTLTLTGTYKVPD